MRSGNHQCSTFGWEKRKLLRISHHESEAIFRIFRAVRNHGPIGYIVLYAAMYAAFGVASPFWPKYFETRGLSSQQIGLLLAAAMLVRLAAGPLIGRLADISGSLRLALASCAALAAASAAAFLW